MDAFDALHHIAGIRLKAGRRVVVDATNVQKHARAELVTLARRYDVLPVAIVLDTPESVAWQRTQSRADRQFGRAVLQRQAQDLRRSIRGLGREGFRKVHIVKDPADITISYERAYNDKREITGPFDIIGDVHGCRSELETLLAKLGWTVLRDDAGRPVNATHPEGRQAVFLGDLVDRGPDSPGVLRLVMGMVAAGTALCVPGNHETETAAQAARTQRHGQPWPGRDPGPVGTREPRVRGVRRDVDRRAGQPPAPGRRTAGRRARRPEGGIPRPGFGAGTRLLPVRRDHRRDRRVRAAGALPVGERLPRGGDGRLRPRAHPEGRMGQQHDLPGHRRRLRWQS